MTIWRFRIDLFTANQNDGRLKIEMPCDARILHVNTQNNTPMLWVETEHSQPTELREFIIVGEDGQVPPDHGPYVGTTLTHEGVFVWHIYEGVANDR